MKALKGLLSICALTMVMASCGQASATSGDGEFGLFEPGLEGGQKSYNVFGIWEGATSNYYGRVDVSRMRITKSKVVFSRRCILKDGTQLLVSKAVNVKVEKISEYESWLTFSGELWEEREQDGRETCTIGNTLEGPYSVRAMVHGDMNRKDILLTIDFGSARYDHRKISD